MTKKDLEIITGELGPLIKRYVGQEIKKALEPIQQKLLELEINDSTKGMRLEAVEQRPVSMIFKGAWEAGAVYAEGDATQFDGSVWVAKTATIGQAPGSSDSWVLACRRGKPGRDGRDAGRLAAAS